MTSDSKKVIVQGFNGSGTGNKASGPTVLPEPDEDYIAVPPKLIRQKGYVKPEEDGKKSDVKGPEGGRLASTALTLHDSMSRTVGRLKPISVKLSYRVTLASSANTAFNTVQSVAPSLAGDFAGYAALYDEVIVDGGHFHFMAHCTVAVPSGNLWGGMAYDPVNFGVYTSVAQICDAAQQIHFPFVASLGPSIITPLGPLMHTFHWKVPKGKPARISGSSNTTNFSGEWSATSDANDSYGFLKPYFEAGPTGVITNVSGFVTLNCRFRMRT